jgi:metallopeptidase MepB
VCPSLAFLLPITARNVLTSNSAEVLAADIFESNFAENPRDQGAWDRYRRGILEYGASRDELHMLQEFLGRAPNPSALLRSLGLKGDGGD